MSEPNPPQPSMQIGPIEHLWAPWREGYVRGTEPVSAGCPFCRLPARPVTEDRDGLIVHRSTHTVVLLNRYPYNPGHLMVVPYAHVEQLDQLDAAALRELWEMTALAVGIVRKLLEPDGVNVGMNLGSAAGAGIADHLHQHVVPRWRGDTNFMSAVGATRVLPQALNDTYSLLIQGFAN